MFRMKRKKANPAVRDMQDSLVDLLELLKPVEEKTERRLSTAVMVFCVVYFVGAIGEVLAFVLHLPLWLATTLDVFYILLSCVFPIFCVIPLVMLCKFLKNPVGQYALGMQKRVERETDLLRLLEKKTGHYLLQHARRVKLEVGFIQRRNTYAAFVVAVCGFLATQLSHSFTIGRHVYDLQGAVPFLIALPLGAALGSVLLFGTMERFDRLGSVLEEAIETRSAQPKVRYEPSSGRYRDRRGTL